MNTPVGSPTKSGKTVFTEAAPPDPAVRAAIGIRAREIVPLDSHAELGGGRPDPVAIIGIQATSRVADLVPIRHGRMLGSPFSFYRGAAAVMAAAGTPTCPTSARSPRPSGAWSST